MLETQEYIVTLLYNLMSFKEAEQINETKYNILYYINLLIYHVICSHDFRFYHMVSLYTNTTLLRWVWRCRPVVLATQEAEEGGSLEPWNSKL